MEAIIAALALLIVGSTVGSAKVVNQGFEALVERTGRYRRTLKPGLNFITPFLDTIVWEETTREQTIDIPPQEVITSDNVSIKADAIVYWKILDLKKAFYEVEDVENAIKNMVITTLRSEIGQMELERTFSSRREINQALLQELDKVTEGWGVKITRVEIQEITLGKDLITSIEKQKAAEIEKRAALEEAEGVVQSIKRISEALRSQPNAREVMQFLLAQKYVEANLKLGESANSKVVFMDPKAMTEALSDLLETGPEKPRNGNP